MIRLQERTHALYQAPDASFGSQMRFFVRWLEKEPFFATTLRALPKPAEDALAWLEEHARWNEGLRLSSDETEAVGELWHVVRHMAAQADVEEASFRTVANFLHERGLRRSDYNRAFLEIFVDPVLTWLKERLLTDDLVLHSLERYAREAAWFRRDELRSRYEADTQHGESLLDSDLRQHLLREGIDFPFSQAVTPSGKPDIVVPDAEADPLPLEVKVYDPDRGRNDRWVRGGFAQSIEYAHDYRRADAYLVVFDMSLDGLSIAGEDTDTHLPVVRESGVSVFAVVVPLGPLQAASKRKTTRRKTLTPDFLRAS